jgi:hypothetical protein
MMASLSFSWTEVSAVLTRLVHFHGVTDNIDDDARKQLTLLMLVWAFLYVQSTSRVVRNSCFLEAYHDCDLVVLLSVIRV